MADTVRLASLKVAADLDASAYKAGAQAKADADAQMVASGQRLSDSVDVTQRKLVSSTTAFEAWKRANVDGYAATQNMQKGLDTLARGLEQGKISADQAAQGLLGLTNRYGIAVTAADLASRGLANLAGAVAAQPGIFAPAAAAADLLTAAHTRGHGSSVALREALVLVHETLSGNYKRAMGSATIEAQALFGAQGLLAAVTNPLTIGLVAAAAAFAASALSAARYRAEIGQMQFALQTVSQGSGETVDSMLRLSQQVADTSSATQNEARKIVIGIAQVGDLGSESFQRVALNAEAFGKVMGEDAAKGAEDLAKMLQDPVKALDELDAKYHFLDPTFKQYVKDLVDSGQAEQARVAVLDRAGLGLDSLGAKVKEQTGFWQGLTKAVNDTYDALGHPIAQTLAQQIDAVKARIANEEPASGAIARTQQSAGGAYLTMLAQPALAQASTLSADKEKLGGLQDEQTIEGINAALAAEYEAQRKLLLQADEAAGKRDAATVQIHALTAENDLLAKAMTLLAVSGDGASETMDKLTAALQANQARIKELQTPTDQFAKSLEAQRAQLQLQVDTFGMTADAAIRVKLARDAAANSDVAGTQTVRDDIVALTARLDVLQDNAKAEADAQKEAEKAQKEHEAASQAIADQVTRLREQAEQYDISARQQAIDIELTKLQAIARRDHRDATEQETQAVVDGVNHLYDMKQAHEAAAQAAQDQADAQRALQKEIEHTTNQITDEGAKLIEDLFGAKSKDAMKAFTDDMVKFFEQAFAKIAAEAFIRPIVQPIVASVASSGILGLGGNASGVSGAAGGRGQLGNLFGLGSSINNFLGGSGPSLFSGVGSQAGALSAQSINEFLAGSAGSQGGEFLAEGGLAEAPTSGILGSGGNAFGIEGLSGLNALSDVAAGAGAAFSIFNFANNPTAGNGIGALGSTIGAGLTIAGFPEIGIPIAIASSLIGGLFKQHPEHPTGQIEQVLGAGGALTGPTSTFTTDKGTPPDASVLTSAFGNFAPAIASQYGLDVSGESLGYLNNAGASSFLFNGNNDRFTNGSAKLDFDPANAQSVTDAMTKLTLEMIQNAKSVANGDLAIARFNIDINDTSQNIQNAINFALNFRDALAAMNAGTQDVTKSIQSQADTAGQALVTQIQQFKDETAKLGLDTQAAADATKSLVDIMVGAKDAAAPLDAVSQAMVTMKANLEALKPALLEVGYSADQADQLIQQGIAKNTSQAQVDYITKLAAEGYSASGLDVVNQLGGFLTEYSGNLQGAASIGLGAGYANNTFADQVVGAIQGLSPQDLQAVIAAFAGADNGDTYIRTAAQTFLNAALVTQAAANTQSAAATAQQQAVTNLQGYVASLDTSSLSPLPLEQQLAIAKAQFANDNASGNVASLQADAQSVLTLGQKTLGAATDDYFQLFTSIKSALTGVIAENPVVTAVNATTAAVASGTQAVVTAITHNSAAANSNNPLAGVDLSGFSAAQISTFTSALTANQASPIPGLSNADLSGFSQDQIATFAHAIGVPGFATGGIIGGTGGVDSVIGLARFTPGEIIVAPNQMAQLVSIVTRLLNVTVANGETLETHLPALASATKKLATKIDVLAAA